MSRLVLALLVLELAALALAPVARAEAEDVVFSVKQLVEEHPWEYIFTFDSADELQQLQQLLQGVGGQVEEGKLVGPFRFNLSQGMIAIVSGKVAFGSLVFNSTTNTTSFQPLLALNDTAYHVVAGLSRSGTIVVYYAPAGQAAEASKFELPGNRITVVVYEADTILVDTQATLLRAIRRPYGGGWRIVYQGTVCSGRWLGPYHVGRHAIVEVYFDESHSGGDFDLRVYDGGRYIRYMTADFGPEIARLTIGSGQLRFYLRHFSGGCQQVIVAYRVIGSSPPSSPGPGPRPIPRPQPQPIIAPPATVTVTQTITQTQTVTATVTQTQIQQLSGALDFITANPTALLIILLVIVAVIALARR